MNKCGLEWIKMDNYGLRWIKMDKKMIKYNINAKIKSFRVKSEAFLLLIHSIIVHLGMWIFQY